MEEKTMREMLSDVQFTLTVNTQELDVISAGLAELPYKISSSVMAKCQGQVNEQLAKLQGKSAEEEEKPAEKEEDKNEEVPDTADTDISTDN